jgi:hypothetical protein
MCSRVGRTNVCAIIIDTRPIGADTQVRPCDYNDAVNVIGHNHQIIRHNIYKII